MNVEGAPGAGEPLTFGKSLTALIPAIIALVLIACVLVAEAKPALHKHVMHLAATVGLLGLVMSAKKVLPAVSEMNWLKNAPNGIIHASSLKPAVMFFSAGLLFIFVALCILSFHQRPQGNGSATHTEESRRRKRRRISRTTTGEDDSARTTKRARMDKGSAKDKGKEKAKRDSDDKKKSDKSPAKPMGPAPKTGEGKLKTSKTTGSPFGEKKKIVLSGKPKSIDPEKAMRPKSTAGQSDGASKPSEKAKPFEQRSGESKQEAGPRRKARNRKIG